MVWHFRHRLNKFLRARPRWLYIAVISSSIVMSDAPPAAAEFAVCNQSIDVINVSIGRQIGGEFQTEGWWTIGANQCANVIRKPLDSRFIYVFATDVFGQEVLNGSTPMCVGVKRFVIRGDDSCWERGYRQEKFFEVDTQSVERWTLFISPPLQ